MISSEVETISKLYSRLFFLCGDHKAAHQRSPEAPSAHQASILAHLDRSGTTTVLNLSRQMGVSASTMSIQVSQLVKRGCIIRQRDIQDARVVNLRLTRFGEAYRGQRSMLHGHLIGAVLETLSRDERRRCIEAFTSLIRGAEVLVRKTKWCRGDN
jgi:DNA-binding MarR family transcriptional regulator